MQSVFLISACSLSIPVFIKTFELLEGYKGGPITFKQVAVVRFLVFEFMVGIFWPSMMKMRAQLRSRRRSLDCDEFFSHSFEPVRVFDFV